MSLGSEFAQFVTATAAAVGGITGIGNVRTRFRPIRDWNAVVAELQATIDGTPQVRTWYVVPGVPVITSETNAIEGQVFDRYRLNLIGLQGTQDDATGFVDALNRAAQVKAVLDALWTFGTGGPVPFLVMPASIDRHDFRYFGKLGVWWTDITFEILVDRDYAVNR